MKYAKIVVKDNYEKRGDLVLRSYIRALKKIGTMGKLFLNSDKAIIFGVVDDENRFHELFTNNIIDYSDYSDLTNSEYEDLCTIIVDLSDDEINLLQLVMEKVLFKKDNEFDLEISTMEELAKDRAIEFDAYDKFLSRINPYKRLNGDNHLYNDYNSFLCKVEQINIMKKLDSKKVEQFDEYEVLENPRKLVKKIV